MRSQLANAAENFVREEKLSSVLMPTMSKDGGELFRLAHKVIEVVVRANSKICVTLLRYNVDKAENSYAQVKLVAKKKGDERFKQTVYVKNKQEQFVFNLM